MKRLLAIICAVVLSVLIVQTTTYAATSDTIAFQARVLSKDRLYAPSGSFNFSFSIYPAQNGGSPVWSEEWSGANQLQVRHGVFTVNLGSLTSLAGVDWSSSNLYLQIAFDADGNGTFEQSFANRMPVTAVPVALSAKKLHNKTEVDFGTLSESEQVSGVWSFTNGVTIGSLNGLLKGANGTVSVATAGSDYQAPLLFGDLSGTANQITVTGGSGAIIGTGVTLTLPQDIATNANPTFDKLTLSSLTAGRIPIVTTSGRLTDTANLLYSSSLYAGFDSNAVTLSSNGQARFLAKTTGITQTAQIMAQNASDKVATLGVSGSDWGTYYGVPGDTAFILSDSPSTNFIVSTTGTQTFWTGAQALLIDTNQKLWIGSTADTNLYRAAADVLRTDDSFVAYGTAVLGNTSSDPNTLVAPGLYTTSVAVGNVSTSLSAKTAVLLGRTSGNGTGIFAEAGHIVLQPRDGLSTIFLEGGSNEVARITDAGQLRLYNSGSTAGLLLGDSAGTYDTNIYRSGTSTLKTDNGLVVGGGNTTVLTDSIKLTVAGGGYFAAPGTSGTSVSLDATAASGYNFRLSSTGTSATWGGEFGGAGNFAIDQGGQVWLWIDPAADKITINSDLEVYQNAHVLSQGDLRLYDADSSRYVGFQSAATVGANVLWTLPDADGGSGTVLKTNGAGTLYWDTDNTAGGGSGTLDDGYNNGRTITVDAGPIIFNDSGTTTSLFDINQSGAITGTAALFDIDYSGSISNAADYAALSLAGVTNAGVGSSIGIDLSGFDYSLQVANAMVLSASKAADATDFLSKKPDATGAQFLFDTSATISTASLFAVNNNGSRKLTLAATGDLLPGSDAAQNIGSTGYRWLNGYFSNSLNVGSTLVLTDGAIKDTNSALAFQANNDTTNYVTLSSNGTNLTFTTTNYADLAISPAGALSLQSNNSEPLSLTSSGGTTITENSSGGITLSGDLYVTGTTAATVTSAAVLQWGSSGLSSPDTNLYRSAANTLKTDDAFTATDTLSVTGSTRGVLVLQGNYNGATNVGHIQFQNDATAVTDLYGYSTGTGASASGSFYFRTMNAGTLTQALQIDSAQKLWIGSTADTNLYRSSANTLMTDDTFVSAGQISGQGFLANRTNTTDALIAGQITSDALNRFSIDVSGTITWGSGAAGRDTNLYRSAANALKTDDTFTAAGGIIQDTNNPDPYKWSGTITTTSINGMVGINLQPTIGSNRDAPAITVGILSQPYVGSSISVPGALSHFRVNDTTLNSGALLGTQYGLYVSSLTAGSANYAIYLAGTGSSNGITLGADTNLYRSAANTLKTDDNVTISGYAGVGATANSSYSLLVDGRATGEGVHVYVSDASSYALRVENSDHAANYFNIDKDGKLNWQGDTNLYRSAASTLKTDDSIVAPTVYSDTVGVTNRDLYIDNTGKLGYVSSSERYKTNIVDLTSTEWIYQLRPVQYNYKTNPNDHIDVGLIAEDVAPIAQQFYADLVSYSSADPTQVETVNYSKLVVPLLQQVQQLHTQIDANTMAIAELQQSVSQLLSAGTLVTTVITSPAGNDLTLSPASGVIVAQGALHITGGIVVTGPSQLSDTSVAGTVTVKDANVDDYELDGTEDDATIGTSTDKAAIATSATETVVTIPTQGDADYSVVVTWNSDPGQPYWVTILDDTHFAVRVANPVANDAVFRYLLIDNN